MLPFEFKALYIIIIAFALMLGLISKKKVGKIIAGMIFFPILIIFLWNMIQPVLMQFPPTERILILSVGFFILLFVLMMGTTFGREIIASFLGGLLLEIFKGIAKLFGGLSSILFRIFRRK